MIHQDVLHLILPERIRGEELEFRDLLATCKVRVLDRHALEIEGDFPEALVRFDVELKPGVFDYRTLYEELTEYPSGEYRAIGPLDLAFALPPHMALPMLAVSVNGDLYGKLWFEMPSLDDLRQQKLGGSFALEFPGAGRHTITISVDEPDRSRLDLFMLERLTVRRDDRRRDPVTPRPGLDRTRPWLFLEGHSVEVLRQLRDTTHAGIWDDLTATVERWLASGETPTRGFPVLATLAFQALLEGPESAAERRLLALLEERRARDQFLVYPGRKFMFLNAEDGLFTGAHRWLMGYGWNDYGFSWILLDYCILYQWLEDRLSAELREWLREGLLRYGRELYRFCLFQRQYGGAQGFYESHSSVPLLAVAALGCALFDVAPGEAPAWAAFGFGRLEEALVVAPEDGRADFLTWGPPWFVQAVELLRDFTGRDERDRPYFRALATALWQTHGGGGYHGRLLTGYTAAHLQDPAGQWYYQRLLSRREAADPGHRITSYLNFLWHSTAAGTDPGAVKDLSYHFPDVGRVLLRTNYEAPRFAVELQCGPTLGHSAAHRLESYAGAASTNPFQYGGFVMSVNGKPVGHDCHSYRRGLGLGNFVCVDEDGFYLRDLYLIGRTEPSRFPWIRTCELGPDLCYVEGFNTLAYHPDLQITRSRRQWFFDVANEWAAVVDDLESDLEHAYRLHLHSSRLEPQGEGAYLFRAQEEALHLRLLPGQPTTCAVTPPELVLSYTFNYTHVKGGAKLTGDAGMESHRPPEIDRLVCRAEGRRRSAHFLTVFSPHPFEAGREGETLTVRTPLGERTVAFH